MFVRHHARTSTTLVACAIFLCHGWLIAQGTSTGRQSPVVASGVVQLSDNSYRNDLLGFKFKLPTGWVVSTDVAGSASGAPQDLASSSGSGFSPSAVYLMRATPSGAGQAPATLYVMAEDLSHLVDVKNPLSYLVRLNNAMSQQRMKFLGISGGIVRASNKTYRALYKNTPTADGGNVAQYYSMDVAILRGHAVVFVISAKDSASLDEMRPLLEGIDFLPDATDQRPFEDVIKPTQVEAKESPKAPAITKEPGSTVAIPATTSVPVSSKEQAIDMEANRKTPDPNSAQVESSPIMDALHVDKPEKRETKPVPTGSLAQTTAKIDSKSEPQGSTAASSAPMAATSPVEPAAPMTPNRVSLPETIMAGYLVSKVPAQYPEFIAAKQRTLAVVVLKVVISTEGRVKSEQQVSGNNDFVIEAMEAVREWRYKPYLVKGVPVEVETLATVTFKP